MQDRGTRQSDSRYLWQNFYHRPGYRNASLHTLLGSVIIRPRDGIAGYHRRIPQCRIATRKGRCREAPSLWQHERTSEMTEVKFKVRGETVKVIVSQVHQSLCVIVKERDLIDNPDISQYGITKRVEPKRILAMVGTYVDDYLTVGQPETVEKFLSYLRRLWNTSDPQYLSQSSELPFLGLTIQRSPGGLFLHQAQYAELPRGLEHRQVRQRVSKRSKIHHNQT